MGAESVKMFTVEIGPSGESTTGPTAFDCGASGVGAGPLPSLGSALGPSDGTTTTAESDGDAEGLTLADADSDSDGDADSEADGLLLGSGVDDSSGDPDADGRGERDGDGDGIHSFPTRRSSDYRKSVV